jgi:hypothetical protein
MRKTALLVAAAIALVILTACAGGKPAPTGSATEIADAIFAHAQVEPFGPSEGLEDDMAKEFYLGSADYPAFADAVAVVPMINIDTRVLVVIKAADKGTVAEIKTKLEQNIDPNKVVCVTFTLEDVAIESRGDVVFLTINTDAAQRESLVEAFRNIE